LSGVGQGKTGVDMRKGVLFGLLGVAAAGVAAVAVSISPQPASSGSVEALSVVRPLASKPGVRSAAAVAKAKAPRVEQPAAATAAGAGALPSAYRILLTRSIFCPHPSGAVRGVPSADSMLALRGILQQGGGFVAFVEDTASKVARQVHVGDSIGRGKVVDIDLHAVKFSSGRQTTRIIVGQTFDGGTSGVVPSGPSMATVHTLPE